MLSLVLGIPSGCSNLPFDFLGFFFFTHDFATSVSLLELCTSFMYIMPGHLILLSTMNCIVILEETPN